MRLLQAYQILLRVIVIVGLLLTAGMAQAQQSYSNLIAFGDSLSATGNNTLGIVINLPPPYFENRISNGLVALDHLAAYLGTTAQASQDGGNNFSIPGGNIEGTDLQDLNLQISAYLDRESNVADPNALYFVMMGGNDLRGIRPVFSADAAQMMMDGIIATFIAEITRLYDAGARQFFIANVPNIGRIPETLQRESSDPGVSDRAAAYTEYFNSELASALRDFRQQTGSTVIEFDTFKQVEQVLDEPANYGFSNSTEGCFDPEELFNPPTFGFHPDCLFGSAFNEFVFFDNLHPTAATHQIVGDAMVQRLITANKPNSIPMAALMLLLLDD